MTVRMIDHGCAWEEPEPLAHKLPTAATTFAPPATLRSLCDSGGGGRRHGDRASRAAARMESASPHRGRSTSPTTEHLARDVPERSEDEARPVTGAAHAGRRGPGGRTGVRPYVGTYGLATSKDWKPAGSRFPSVGSPAALPVQTLEEQHARSSDDRKTGTGALPVTGRAIRDVLPLHRSSVTLEPGSNILKEPRPFWISGDFAALRVSGGGVRDD
jgi:hypothetical protein